MSININVGIIGFSHHEQEKFKWIFGAGLERDRTYHLKDLAVDENIDLLIVKTAAESALKKLESYQQQYGEMPVVTAGREAVEGYEYHIQGVLLLSRVLKVLDLVALMANDDSKPQLERQQSVDSDSVNVGGQYDILVVNEDEDNRQLLRNELLKSDIPLNIDFALNDAFAIEKINEKYYDFLFVDAETANFEAIDQSLKANDRSSVVMPTTKAEAVEYSHVVLRILKSFADADNMIVSSDTDDIDHSGYRVLVVDDSEMMHKALKLEFDKSGINLQADYVLDGSAALINLETKHYDFIFLDVMMPGLDGFETCAKIRKIEKMSKLPIIMLTAKTSPLDEVKGIISGCTTYLTKPIESDEFQKMLLRIMRWIKDFNYKD
ncbi:MAG: response regulator [Methylococcales bacterium]|nr:response regulator [Methylococcales bacterium]